MVLHSEGMGSETKFARPHIYLGGLQVDEKDAVNQAIVRFGSLYQD